MLYISIYNIYEIYNTSYGESQLVFQHKSYNIISNFSVESLLHHFHPYIKPHPAMFHVKHTGRVLLLLFICGFYSRVREVIISSILCATAMKSSLPKPFVVIAAVPMRTPEVCMGLRFSPGTLFLFSVMARLSSAC